MQGSTPLTHAAPLPHCPPPRVAGLNSSTAPVYIVDGLAAANASAGELRHHRDVKITGFAAKVHALCYVARHREVLLLDADSMPLLHPDTLFSSPQYVAHGSLFWPDFWHSAWIKPEMYLQHGIRPPWEGDREHRLADSGQVLLDRWGLAGGWGLLPEHAGSMELL